LGNLPLIESEPVRAAIAFKWAAYGKSQWRWHVIEYAVFTLAFLSGVGLLLTTEDDIDTNSGSAASSRMVGGALFALASLSNLRYIAEEGGELLKDGPAKYFSSMTNIVDFLVSVLVLALAPLLVVGSADAAPVAAIAAVLIFLRAQKVRLSYGELSSSVRGAPHLCIGSAHSAAQCVQ
jgi:hypothetical protein